MTIDATQEGVSDVEEIEEENDSLPKTQREEDYEALIAKRQQEREQEEGDQIPFSEEPAEEPVEPEEPTPDDRIVFFDEDGQEIRLSPNSKIKLTIDDKEQEETLDHITRTYQKGAAAEMRFREVAAQKKELQQLEQQLIAKGHDISRREQFVLEELQKLTEKNFKPAGLSEDAQQENLKKAKALFDAMVDSEDPVNKLAAVLPLLTPQSQPQTIDRDELRKDLKHTIKAEIELDEARRKFRQEYSDLAKDPEFHSLVNERTKWLQDVRPNATYWEIIKEAAEGVKVKFSPQAPQPEPKPKPKPEPLPAPKIPTPKKAGGRSTLGTDPKPPQTREQILEEMRQSRAQGAL